HSTTRQGFMYGGWRVGERHRKRLYGARPSEGQGRVESPGDGTRRSTEQGGGPTAEPPPAVGASAPGLGAVRSRRALLIGAFPLTAAGRPGRRRYRSGRIMAPLGPGHSATARGRTRTCAQSTAKISIDQ